MLRAYPSCTSGSDSISLDKSAIILDILEKQAI